MKRVNLIAAAALLAVVAVLAGGASAQETNVSERTFLTFSGAVEMPGVTLQPGTYVFKLADTPSRNVVQVWDRDEKNMIGHWLFVQAERPEVTSENVVMFKEMPAGSTPAVQFWYFPGEKIGKEFIYPKDQAERIARAAGVGVRTESGIIEGPGIAAVEAAQPEPAPAPAPESVEARVEVEREPAVPEPAPQIAEAQPAPEPVSEPRAVGTSGRADELPRTAGPVPLTGLIGLLSLAGALGLRAVRR